MGCSASAHLGYGCVVNLENVTRVDDDGEGIEWDYELMELLLSKLPNVASFDTMYTGYLDYDDGTTVLVIKDTVVNVNDYGCEVIPRPETAHGSRELLETALAAMGIKEHGKIGWILGASYG